MLDNPKRRCGSFRRSSPAALQPDLDLSGLGPQPRDPDDLAAFGAGFEWVELQVGIARVESAFTANVLSPVAAVGLSQVMPYVADRLGCGDLFDPAANLDCGARVLAGFLRSFGGNLVSALSGYNAGYGMPTRARKETRTPRNFQYVEDVLRARARWLRKGCAAWD